MSAQLLDSSALADPREAFLKLRRQSRIAVEIWPWLVGLVAVMLVPDIALRRVGPAAFTWVARLGRRRRDDAGNVRGETREGTNA